MILKYYEVPLPRSDKFHMLFDLIKVKEEDSTKTDFVWYFKTRKDGFAEYKEANDFLAYFPLFVGWLYDCQYEMVMFLNQFCDMNGITEGFCLTVKSNQWSSKEFVFTNYIYINELSFEKWFKDIQSFIDFNKADNFGSAYLWEYELRVNVKKINIPKK